MKFFILIQALLASAVLPGALALPAELRALSSRLIPGDTARLAFDNSTGTVHAFGKSGEDLGSFVPDKVNDKVEKRAGTCSPLNVDDVQKIPGWSKLTDKAKEFWGDGGYDLKINLEEYPDNPANLCTSNSAAEITLTGEPQCSKSAQSTAGQFTNTDGTLTLTNTYTEVASNSLTVTKTSKLGASITVSATVGWPGVVDVTSGFTTSVDITNTQSSESHTDKTHTLTQTTTMNAKAGQTCKLEFNTATCVGHGNGQVQFVASGWVWFAYHDKVDGHWFWALNMNAYLEEGDRSSSIDVDAVINLESTSDYKGTCA